jgi:hypothetical protein
LGVEIFDEILSISPFAGDKMLNVAMGFGLMWGDAVPIEGVVPMLGSVVEDLGIFAAE